MRGFIRGFTLSLLLTWAESSATWPPKPQPMTEYQKGMLNWAAPIAAAASRAAEPELLEAFSSQAYQQEIEKLGDAVLATLSANETLDRLKAALDSIEYGTTFGLGPLQRAQQPGMSSPNISTIDNWGGVYPNQWQLKYYNSTLVKGLDTNGWNIYTGGEVGLYHLKPFANPLHPTWEETAERPTYVTINDRRVDSGNEVFGEYTLVYRGSVVKNRAVIIPADSGEWQNACNSSIHTQRKWWWKVLENHWYHCEGFGKVPGGPAYGEPGWHPTPARPGMELHTIVSGAKIISQSLPRLLAQILSPNAEVDFLETMFYSEAALLGSVRMQDAKFLLVGFSVFGTPDGDKLIDFCRRYSMPILWARGWPDGPKVSHWWNLLPPPLGPTKIPAGRARILDISTIPFTNGFTNGTAPSRAATAAWKEVEDKVRAFKETGKEPVKEQLDDWWEQLGRVKTHVFPIRGAECPNTDLCFGIDAMNSCVCRNDPDAASIII